ALGSEQRVEAGRGDAQRPGDAGRSISRPGTVHDCTAAVGQLEPRLREGRRGDDQDQDSDDDPKDAWHVEPLAAGSPTTTPGRKLLPLAQRSKAPVLAL